MYKRKLAIVAILAATVLLLVTTYKLAIGSVLAVKTGATHNITSSSGSNIGGRTANTSTITATLDTSTSKDLKDLFACESTASKGHGGLTQDGVMNCYTKTFRSNLALPAAPDSGNSNGANTKHHNGSISHTHNYSSGKSTSSPSAAALSGLG
jgi:hypothetical protein